MSILVNKDTKVAIAGITGREGSFHSRLMMQYGTNVVAGIHPKKGGTTFDEYPGKSVPIFTNFKEAVAATGADAAMVIVPPFAAPGSIRDAADAGIPLVVAVTEYIPVIEMLKVRAYIDQSDTRMIGPNCPGVLTPGECKIGFIPGPIASLPAMSASSPRAVP
jgi:succinyl-CoA synthetase alpha subunit